MGDELPGVDLAAGDQAAERRGEYASTRPVVMVMFLIVTASTRTIASASSVISGFGTPSRT
ncbi:MAG TPA: hypothetical protein VMK13_02570 [Streptosporangiaceae bacterium]|nr:hypothetical protein [Streptosporangiaceae bacterium]